MSEAKSILIGKRKFLLGSTAVIAGIVFQIPFFPVDDELVIQNGWILKKGEI